MPIETESAQPNFQERWQTADLRNKNALIQEFVFIEDPSVAEQTSTFLENQYATAEDLEQETIIRALSEIGWRCREARLMSIDFLVGLLRGSRNHRPEIINALKGKANQIHTAFVAGKEPTGTEKDVLDQIMGELLQIMNSDVESRETRLNSIKGLAGFKNLTTLAPGISEALKHISDSEDKQLANAAIDELVFLSKPGDSFMIKKLEQKISSVGWEELNTDEKSKLLHQIGWLGDQSFLPFLSNLPSGGDAAVEQNISWAVRKINERGEENEKNH